MTNEVIHKKGGLPDTETVGGLVGILTQSIADVNNASPETVELEIKKNNAIVQSVNAIRGIYSLAFNRERLHNIAQTQILDTYSFKGGRRTTVLRR